MTRTSLKAITALFMLAPAAAYAQAAPSKQASPPPSTNASSSDADQGLGEIVVTALRRSEDVQRTAVPVDVVRGSEVVNAGLTQINNLGTLVPAVNVQNTTTGNNIFIRGVGNFTGSATADPATAFNYDGVYIGRTSSTTGLLFDLERVEVLKGPQGTLYGRNATAGAVNILPVQPRLGEFSGYGTFSYGSYNSVNAEGAINVPLGKDAAVRLSASTARHDGYLDDGTQDDRVTSVRAQIKARLGSMITVRVAGDYSHTGGSGPGSGYLGVYGFNTTAGAYVFRPANLPDNSGFYSSEGQAFRQTVSAGPNAGRTLDPLAPLQTRNDNFYGLTGEINVDTGIGTLTILPAWRDSKQFYINGGVAFGFRLQEEDKQFSTEVRFTGNRVGPFDYILGGYYFDENINGHQALNLSSSGAWIDQALSTKSYAAFARATLHLSDQLRLVGGIRYTDDKKTFDSTVDAGAVVCVRFVAGVRSCPTAPLLPLVASPSLLPFTPPAPGGAPVTLGTSGAIFARLALGRFTAKSDNDNTSYHAGVEFDVAPHSLAYFNFDTGYRSGGFNAATGFETFAPEYITTYTLGLKNRLFDNRLVLNFEGFLWRYRDQQISHVGVDGTGRVATFIENVGRSNIQGVEADATWLVTPSDIIRASVQYLDARYKSFTYRQSVVANAPPLTSCPYAIGPTPTLYTVNCSGFPAYFSPKWTFNIAAQHVFAFGDNRLTIGADTQYKSKRYVGFAYLPQQLVDGNWRSNAQISFGPKTGSWQVSAFVRNIENKRVITASGLNPGNSIVTDARTDPRTYGVRVSGKF